MVILEQTPLPKDILLSLHTAQIEDEKEKKFYPREAEKLLLDCARLVEKAQKHLITYSPADREELEWRLNLIQGQLDAVSNGRSEMTRDELLSQRQQTIELYEKYEAITAKRLIAIGYSPKDPISAHVQFHKALENGRFKLAQAFAERCDQRLKEMLNKDPDFLAIKSSLETNKERVHKVANVWVESVMSRFPKSSGLLTPEGHPFVWVTGTPGVGKSSTSEYLMSKLVSESPHTLVVDFDVVCPLLWEALGKDGIQPFAAMPFDASKQAHIQAFSDTVKGVINTLLHEGFKRPIKVDFQRSLKNITFVNGLLTEAAELKRQRIISFVVSDQGYMQSLSRGGEHASRPVPPLDLLQTYETFPVFTELLFGPHPPDLAMVVKAGTQPEILFQQISYPGLPPILNIPDSKKWAHQLHLWDSYSKISKSARR